VVSLVALACSNSSGKSDEGAEESSQAVAVDAPGVSETEIRVGGVASITNPLSGKYDQVALGVKAYFQMVNESGGIYGRELNLVAEKDDNTSNNDAAVQELLTQDDVFAVLPVATLLYTGADRLVDAKVPTFGWNINAEWGGTAEEPRDNLFGQNGSFLCLGCSSPVAAYVADQLDAKKIGLLAYNVPQSADCATGDEKTFEQYAGDGSATIVFADKAMAFGGGDFSVQVSQMKDAGVDLVVTCMDLQGVVALAREMKRQSLDAPQYLLNAYDPELLTDFGDLFQDSIVLTFFAPFEVEDPPEGLKTYLEWMEKTDTPANENTVNGWLNAALFVDGLREAGENFSRQKVIDAINSMTDWNGDGLLYGVDWTKQHIDVPNPQCNAFSRVDGDKFVPVFGEPGKPFVCLDADAEGVPEGTPSA
jgi:ABC-type branched-subunit amino acid transport system substrate-binding protein